MLAAHSIPKGGVVVLAKVGLAGVAGVLGFAGVAQAHTVSASCAGFTPSQVRVHVDAQSFAASGAGNGGVNTVTYGVAVDGVVLPVQQFSFPGSSGNADYVPAVSNGSHVVVVSAKWDASDTRDGHSQARVVLFSGACATLPLPPVPPSPPAPPVPPFVPPVVVSPPVESPVVVEPPVEAPVVVAPVVLPSTNRIDRVVHKKKPSVKKAGRKVGRDGGRLAKKKHRAGPRKPRRPYGFTG
jgi:hypothetical protein